MGNTQATVGGTVAVENFKFFGSYNMIPYQQISAKREAQEIIALKVKEIEQSLVQCEYLARETGANFGITLIHAEYFDGKKGQWYSEEYLKNKIYLDVPDILMIIVMTIVATTAMITLIVWLMITLGV